MTLGDRIVIMKDGFIQQIGTPQEVFDHPANLFVAGFIGTPQMNFFDGKLEKDDKGYYVSLYGSRIDLPADKQAKLQGQEARGVIVGIRPDHVTMCQPDDPSAITATVDVHELMGSTIHLHVNIQGKDAVVILPTVELGDNIQSTFGYGAKVNVTFGGNVIHLFDKETEKSLL